ncbi:MAG: Minf_1886 family protein [Planctomycetota bacterium]
MPIDQSHPIGQLLQRDRRYKLDAYLFVLEALSFAQESLGLGEEPPAEELEPPGDQRGMEPGAGERQPVERGRGTEPGEERAPASAGRRPRQARRRRGGERHLTGQQLCEAARLYALQQYGLLSRVVLGSWGIVSTDDLGEIVFNMIEIGQMRKTRRDKREDFHAVYDFHEAFSRDPVFVPPDDDDD